MSWLVLAMLWMWFWGALSHVCMGIHARKSEGVQPVTMRMILKFVAWPVTFPVSLGLGVVEMVREARQ